MRSAVAAFLIALAVYGTAHAVMNPPATGDEPHYALEAISLASDGDRDLRNDYASRARVARANGGFAPLATEAYRYGSSPRLMPVHSPGLAVLLAPVAAAGGSIRAMRIEMVVLAALAAALLMALLRSLPLGVGPALRWAAWASVVFSVPVLVFSDQLYPELAAALLVLAALRALVAQPRPATLALAGACAALLPWIHVRFGLAAVALILGALWRAGPTRRWAPVLAPALVSLAGLVVSSEAWYASPWPTAMYAPVPSNGSLAQAYRVGVSGLLDRQTGWLPYAPVHLVALAGLGVAVRRLGRPMWLALVAALAYALVVAFSGVAFGGFTYPGRLDLVLVPLAAVPLCLLLARSRAARVAFAALGLASIALSAEAVAHPQSLLFGPSDLAVSRATRDLWPDLAAHERAADLRLAAHPRGDLVVDAASPSLEPGTYTVAFPLRAGPRPPAAEVSVGDERHPLTGLTLRSKDLKGGRDLILTASITAPHRLHARVRLLGVGAVHAGPVQVVSINGSRPAALSRAFPDWGLSLAWLAGIAALALLARRRTSAATARPTAATRSAAGG